MKKITRREWSILIDHIHRDIGFGGGGTFCTGETDENGNDVFDKKQADVVIRTLEKIAALIREANKR